MAQISEAQEAANDIKEAIATYGTLLSRTRPSTRKLEVRTASNTKRITFLVELIKQQSWVDTFQPYGITNQNVPDNHDVFYCLPTDDIREGDTIFFDGFDRKVTNAKTYPLSNVNIVRICYVARESKK